VVEDALIRIGEADDGALLGKVRGDRRESVEDEDGLLGSQAECLRRPVGIVICSSLGRMPPPGDEAAASVPTHAEHRG
jgi:hypothetical protein